MKKIITFFLFFFCVFTFSKNSLAESNVTFIDVDYIYSNSIVGKKIDNKLKLESKKINDELSDYKDKMQNEKDKLTNQKKIISEDEFKNKAIVLENKILKFNKNISDKNKEFIKYKNESMKIFLKELMNVVREYADNNSIHLVLKKENIIIAKNDLDISGNILELLNKKVKDIKLKWLYLTKNK